MKLLPIITLFGILCIGFSQCFLSAPVEPEPLYEVFGEEVPNGEVYRFVDGGAMPFQYYQLEQGHVKPFDLPCSMVPSTRVRFIPNDLLLPAERQAFPQRYVFEVMYDNMRAGNCTQGMRFTLDSMGAAPSFLERVELHESG